MDDVDPAFQQAWAADYQMTGDQLTFWDRGAWPYEGGGYWFDGLTKLAYALHDSALIDQVKSRIDVVAQQHARERHPVHVVARQEQAARTWKR